MEALYPKQVKTSSELVRDTTVSTEYAVSPAGFLARRQSQMEKAAAALSPLPEKTYVPPPREEHDEVRRQYSRQQAEKRAAEELRRQATAAYSKAAASMDAVVDYFRAPGNMPYGDAIREVELRFGQPGVSVLQKAAAVYPVIEKQAATKEMRLGHDRVYDLVNTALEDVHAYVAADNANPLKKAEAVCKKTASNILTGSVLQDPIDGPLELKTAWNILDEDPDVSQAYTGRTSFSGGDRDLLAPAVPNPFKGRGPSPNNIDRRLPSQRETLPAAHPASSTTSDDWSVGDMPAFDAAIADVTKREQSDADTAKEEAKFQAQLERNRAETAKRKNDSAVERTRQEAAEFEAGEKAKEKAKTDAVADYEKGRKEREEAAKKVPPPKSIADLMRSGWGKGVEAAGEVAKRYPDSGFTLKDIPGSIAAPTKLVGNLMSGTANILGFDEDPAALKLKAVRQLSSPEHETTLRNIRAQGTLHDLVLNDPLISGYDPHEVAMAFNDLSEIAPNLVDSPGVLQALLRKRLESGQLADFDVKQLLEMDKLRAERDMVQAATRKTQQEAL